LSLSASKWGLIASGTTLGGLSARYCLSVSASMLAVMLAVSVSARVGERQGGCSFPSTMVAQLSPRQARTRAGHFYPTNASGPGLPCLPRHIVSTPPNIYHQPCSTSKVNCWYRPSSELVCLCLHTSRPKTWPVCLVHRKLMALLHLCFAETSRVHYATTGVSMDAREL
jgi:hypothetical protein